LEQRQDNLGLPELISDLPFCRNQKQGRNVHSTGRLSSQPLDNSSAALLQEIRYHHEACKKRDEAAHEMMNKTLELMGIALHQITEIANSMAARDDAATARKVAKNVNKTKKAGDFNCPSFFKPQS
jgi:hypothetical protein